MQGLKGKVAVCTGSGRANGLGAAILRRLAAEGCAVVVSDLGVADRMLGDGDIGCTDEMNDVAEQLRALGARVLVVPCDVRKDADVKNLIAKTVAEFGQHRYPGQQCGCRLHAEAFHRIYPGRMAAGARRQPDRRLSCAQSTRPCR